MDLLFGRRKTPEELLRQNQRALNRAMRELDRERQKLETQEKQKAWLGGHTKVISNSKNEFGARPP